jgi:exocyst complex protein 7
MTKTLRRSMTLSLYLCDSLDALEINLDTRAKLYKKPVSSAIFLMNNFYYILKNVKGSNLADYIPSTHLLKFEALYEKYRSIYLNTWNSILEHCKDLSMTKVNTKQEKKQLKEKFKVRSD